ETALMPIVAPARTLRFVVSSLIVPLQRSDFAADLNGDGKVDHQIGNFLGALIANGFDVQRFVDEAIAGFVSPLLLRVDTERADLTADQRIDITIAPGTVLEAGKRMFTVDPSGPSVRLLGRLRSGRVESQPPLLGGAVLTVTVTLVVSGVPLALPLRAAQVSFKLADDGSSIVNGQINGGMGASEVQSRLAPSLAAMLSARVAA